MRGHNINLMEKYLKLFLNYPFYPCLFGALFFYIQERRAGKEIYSKGRGRMHFLKTFIFYIQKDEIRLKRICQTQHQMHMKMSK